MPFAAVSLLASLSASPLLAGSDGSGGPAAAHGPNGKPITKRSITRNAPDPRLFRLGHGAGEPTLGITDMGNVFITASDSCVTSCPGSEEALGTVAPGGRAVFVTRDDGESWEDVTPLPEHPLSLDPMIYADERTSRVFDVDLYIGCSWLSYTDDEGASWITNPAACGEPVNDHQTIFAGPPVTSSTIEYPNVVYYCFNHPGFTQCSKSLDGGLTFVRTASVEPPACSGLNGHGLVDKEGTIYLPLGSNCGEPTLAISEDEGDSWQTIRVSDLSAGPQDPSVAVDGKGNLYYVFTDEAKRLPYLVTSTDGGTTWSKPVMIGAPGVKDANLVTVDVGNPGNIAVAYYGTEGKTTPLSWNGYLMIGRDVLGKRPLFYTGTVNDPSEPLKINECGPGRCGRVLDFIDVEISPSGQAWGAYVDACLVECEETQQESIHDNEGVVGTLVGGFPLR